MTMYTIAPIKRMSILERRPGDDRAFFLRHWRDIHGGMVANLPYLFAYHQNHVLEDFDCGMPGYPADGFVEQLWRSTAQMQRGYNSPAVKVLIGDEPNYLGHGSNYAILAEGPLRHVPDGRKLIVSLRHGGQPELIDELAGRAASCCGDMVRDDVIATIAKPNMLPVQPRPVDAFLHLYFADVASAQAAAKQLTQIAREIPFGAGAAFGLHRVATAVIIAAPAG